MNTLPKCLTALALLPLVSFVGTVHAACAAHDLHVAVPTLSYVGPADAPIIGKQIGSGWGGTSNNVTVLEVSSCPAQYSYAEPIDTPVPGVTYSDGTTTYPVYPTGVAGIGYVMGLRDNNATQWVAIKPPNAQTYPAPGTGTGVQTSTLGWWVRVLFVATGQLKSGAYPLPSKRLARVWGANSSKVQTSPNAYLVFDGSTINVTAKGCDLTSTQDMAVELPAVNVAQFGSVGSSPAASASFDVSLSCQSGVAVYATMTDANAPGSRGTALALGGASTASGVGVRLFRNGLSTPLAFGPDSSAIGNVNQWLVGGGTSASATTYSIPFIARYVQLASSVSPGSVEAAATITLSYQ